MGVDPAVAHHGLCLLPGDPPVDVNVAGLHACQALQRLPDHDGAASEGGTLALQDQDGCTAQQAQKVGWA